MTEYVHFEPALGESSGEASTRPILSPALIIVNPNNQKLPSKRWLDVDDELP